MMMERHSHKKFWLAIGILAIVVIIFLVATSWMFHELNEAQNTLLIVDVELEKAQTQLSEAKAKLATVETKLNTSEARVSNLLINLERTTRGYRYVLRDPSYQEMREFLTRDRTSEREWMQHEYTCVDFARDVKANATRERIRSAFVLIEHPEGGHAIVSFYTTDRGLVFIEPQFDWKVEPRIGRRFYQSLRPPPSYRVPSPDWDDTITRIIIIW